MTVSCLTLAATHDGAEMQDLVGITAHARTRLAPSQDLALSAADARPGTLLESGAGGLHGPVDILLVAGGNLRQGLAGRGFVHMKACPEAAKIKRFPMKPWQPGLPSTPPPVRFCDGRNA